MAEKTETEGPQGLTITQLVEKIKQETDKDVEQQNLRATLRNLVKKGDLVHEPRTRWAFDDADTKVVVDHYKKAPAADPDSDEAEDKPAKPAKNKGKGSTSKKEEPAAEADNDDDDLELEDI